MIYWHQVILHNPHMITPPQLVGLIWHNPMLHTQQQLAIHHNPLQGIPLSLLRGIPLILLQGIPLSLLLVISHKQVNQVIPHHSLPNIKAIHRQDRDIYNNLWDILPPTQIQLLF
jgi:hypothetical protein